LQAEATILHDDYLRPPECPKKPCQAPPAGSTDCHAHVFGPFDVYPVRPKDGYIPFEQPGERFLATLDAIGFTRGVLVQPSGYGTDCGAMLRAMALAPQRLRGIALIDANVSDEALRRLDERGIRGVRFSAAGSGYSVGALDLAALEQLAPRLMQLGWHAQILTPCATLIEAAPFLLSSGLPLVVENFALIDAQRGINDPSFVALLRLLERGLVWLKIVPSRVSRNFPDYEDIAPFHRAVLAANPERLLWGSDWPHVRTKRHMPDIGHLLDLFSAWTCDEALRRQILVINPARLYGL
jgi:2-pyrone-4,6-dicarboxylate lactonase